MTKFSQTQCRFLLLTTLCFATPITAMADIEGYTLSTKGGLKLSADDGSSSLQIGGRIMWDYDTTEADFTDGVDTFNVEDDDLELRRGRIKVQGHYNEWAYKINFNVLEDGEDEGVEDMYIQYKGWGKPAVVTVGRMREPFGLEQLTSSNDITMLERSAATEAFAPGRDAGVRLSGSFDNHFTYGVGFYRDDNIDNEGVSQNKASARVTYAPINETGNVIHLGLAYQQPFSNDEAEILGLEFAAVVQQFHFQAEYFNADDADLDTFYAQAGYVIKGNPRPYKGGKFKRVNSDDGAAYEIAIRYEDGYGRYNDTGLDFGEGEQLSVGFNIYPNDIIRLGIAYMDAEIDDTIVGDGDELRIRTQIAF